MLRLVFGRRTITHADYVSLADVTYEGYVIRIVAFDAMKWEPR